MEEKYILDICKNKMDEAFTDLNSKFSDIRSGRISTNIVSKIFVDYYGNKCTLDSLSNIVVLDATTISITPWDKSAIPEIEKAIFSSNKGINPINKGDCIIIHIPPMTEERRLDLCKQAKMQADKAKVAIRNVRKHIKNIIKSNLEYSEDENKKYNNVIQNITDEYIIKIDNLFKNKESDIMKL